MPKGSSRSNQWGAWNWKPLEVTRSQGRKLNNIPTVATVVMWVYSNIKPSPEITFSIVGINHSEMGGLFLLLLLYPHYNCWNWTRNICQFCRMRGAGAPKDSACSNLMARPITAKWTCQNALRSGNQLYCSRYYSQLSDKQSTMIKNKDMKQTEAN